MTSEERLISNYLWLKPYEKRDSYKIVMLKKHADLTPKIEEAIESIFETKTKEQFYEELVKRIMKDHSSEIKVNRCTKCDRITRTDKSK